MASASNSCTACNKFVRPRQEAIQCDIADCLRWTHRTCNTGISRDDYRRAVREKEGITFVCNLCTSAADKRTSTEPSLQLQLPAHESTRTSLANSILEEENERSDNAEIGQFNIDYNSSANSTFDISRDQREIHAQQHEASIDDEIISREGYSISEAEVTYQVVENGSECGKRKLVSSDGYTFVHKRVQKNGCIVWRCSVRGKSASCPVVVNQLDSNFTKNGSSHIHQAKPGILKSVQIKAEVKSIAKNDMFEPASTIVKKVSDNHNDPDLPEVSRPVEGTVIRICNRARSDMRPKDPVDLSFELDIEYINATIKEEFYRGDVTVGNCRHLIFATSTQLSLLEKSKTWYIDGTFKVIKQPFQQLLSIHAFIKSGDDMKQVPLCFVLMSGKSKRDYRKVLSAILTLLPEVAVTSVVVDFESGLWQALKAVFDDISIHGCAFHFGQALWSKVQENGLQIAYSTNDGMHKLLRKVFALPFLPADDIESAFSVLKDKIPEDHQELNTFMEYVEKTWLNNPVWDICNWSVFGRSMRTNNDVEGWHNKLNKRAKKANLPFYLLLTLLYSEVSELKTQVKLLSEGKWRRAQRKRTKQLEEKLMQLWDSYNQREISTNKLLKECAKIYAP